MINLTYGRKKPQKGDKGAVYFPALEANVALDDAHVHDGVTSAPIESRFILKGTRTLLVGSWVADGVRYAQVVTMPVGYASSNSKVVFRVSGGDLDGSFVHPEVKVHSASEIKVSLATNAYGLVAYFI